MGLRSVEREFHLGAVVEGMHLSSKLLRIGRRSGFAVARICSGHPLAHEWSGERAFARQAAESSEP